MLKKYYYKLTFLVIACICAGGILLTNYTPTYANEKSVKKVVFIVHTQSVGGKGVYEIYKEMKHLGIDVKIAMIPLFYDNKKLKEEIDFEFAQKFDRNDMVFPCGTKEPYVCQDIEFLKADYIFTQMPYNPYVGSPLSPYFTNEHLKKICKKLAMIVYYPHVYHQVSIHNSYLSTLVDIVFVDSEVAKKIHIEGFNFKEENVLVSGYQPYKTIRDELKNKPALKHPETLLWLPRWQLSFRDRELYESGSTFLNYHYYFYNFLKENPDINLIVRPHYGLFLLRSKFLNQQDLMGILDRLASLPNVTISYHQETSLADDILKSDIIISDGSSALGEVVIADKPIIYLSNGTNNEFNSNELSKRLKQEIFLAYDPLDIEKYIEVIRADNYKAKYSQEFKEMLDPVENPAKNIAEYILHN